MPQGIQNQKSDGGHGQDPEGKAREGVGEAHHEEDHKGHAHIGPAHRPVLHGRRGHELLGACLLPLKRHLEDEPQGGRRQAAKQTIPGDQLD